jgi:hypothetical protein
MPVYPLSLVEASPSLLKDADGIFASNIDNEDDHDWQLWGAYTVPPIVPMGVPPHANKVVIIQVENMDQVDRARAAVELAKGRPEVPV